MSNAYNRQARRGLHTASKRWRAIRQQVLAEQPLCPVCEAQGRIEPAVDVDHIDNDSHNNSRENLRGLCKSHHSEKTATEARGGTWRMKGVDANGWPLDPNHSWNEGSNR